MTAFAPAFSLLRRAALLGCLLSVGALFAAGNNASAADTYPNRTITLIVGYPPGGSVDLTGRLVAEGLAAQLGQPVVVENIGGAGGTIGAQRLTQAAPDGYTLLVGANNELAIARLINKNVKYTPEDFTPIGVVSSQPLVLVASHKTGVKTLADFTRLVSQSPDQYSYGSSGIGTALHLAGEMVKEQAGLALTHVPYRGVAPLTNDLLGENIEFGFFVLSSGLPQIRAGKVIALGTTEAQRSPVTPEIPALSETPQFKNVNINVWFALMAPKGLPEPIAAKLKTALHAVMASPEFRQKMQDSGSTVADPALDAHRYISDEISKYTSIVQFANIEN